MTGDHTVKYRARLKSQYRYIYGTDIKVKPSFYWVVHPISYKCGIAWHAEPSSVMV